MSPDPRAAVVGAGLSGLAAGIALARRGYRVEVYEANDKAGGCCASTLVDGYRFHDGALNFGLPGLLDAGFARLGLDRERLLPLHEIRCDYSASFEDGRSVRVADGRVAISRASEPSPVFAVDGVTRLLERWRPVLRVLTDDLLPHRFSFSRAVLRGGRQLLKLHGTVGAELRRHFTDEAAQAALAGFLLYAGLPPDRLPITSIIGLVALLDDGFYLPVGGMGRIPEVLTEVLQASGGVLHPRSPVERIVIEAGRVRGLEVAGHGRVSADVVVSSASGMATFGRLVPQEAVPRSLQRRVTRAPLSHTALCIQLGLRNQIALAGHGAVLPPMRELHRVLEGSEADRWLNWFVPTAAAPELAPAGGSIVEIFCPVQRDRPRTPADDARLADRVVEALALRHPLDVAVRRVRGPDAFASDLHLFKGALYGLSPAARPAAHFPHRTPIAGLFQTGQTTYPGYGVPTAILAGILTAEEVARLRGQP